MSEANLCPQCRSPLAADGPRGLCPQCLLRQGVASAPVGEPAATAGRESTAFIAPDPHELDRRFPQLEIVELLGQGGMGAVYLAQQTMLDRTVALKILPPEVGVDPTFAERFTREARALRGERHQDIQCRAFKICFATWQR